MGTAISPQYFSFSLHFQNTQVDVKGKENVSFVFLYSLSNEAQAYTVIEMNRVTLTRAHISMKRRWDDQGRFTCLSSLLLRVNKQTGFWLVNLMNKSLSMTPSPMHTHINPLPITTSHPPPLSTIGPLAHLLPLRTLAHIHVAVHYIVSRCALGLCQQKLNSSEKINIILLHYPFKTHAN